MAQSILTEKELRIWGMDHPAVNTLVDNIRFTPEDIEQAIFNVVDYFNILPPPNNTAYTAETFPSRALLALGVWGWLMRGASIGEASNELEYSSGGVQINDRSKSQLFASLGKDLWDEFKEASQMMKLTQSINAVYGVKNSEYNRLRRY